LLNKRKLYLLFNWKFLFILIFFLSINCQKKNEENNYIVRVNNSYLFEKDLNLSQQAFNENKEELINNWIEDELLYQEALKKGLIENDEFKLKFEIAKKQIAKSLLLEKFFEDKKIDLNEVVLKDFYEKNKVAFKLKRKSFYLNQVVFNNEESALKFRDLLSSSNWKGITSLVNKNSGVESIINKKLFYDYELSNNFLYNIVNEIDENEITPVLELDDSIYTIIQLLKKFNDNDIPDYNIIQEEVKEFFIQVERKKLLDDYLKELFSKNEIEIRK